MKAQKICMQMTQVCKSKELIGARSSENIVAKKLGHNNASTFDNIAPFPGWGPGVVVEAVSLERFGFQVSKK